MSAALTFISLLVVGALLVTTDLDRSPERSPDPEGSALGGARSFVWSDEFGGRRGSPPDSRKWRFETGYGWGDGELQSYTDRAANAALDGRGHLAITARRERYTGPDGRAAKYTSARINSQGNFEFAYGRVEARIRLPRGHGLLPAFWALGSNLDTAGWPAAGEIDMMEVNGNEPFTVHGTLHGPRAERKDYALEAMRRTAAPLASGFHVYGVTWSPGRITFRLDGAAYAVRRSSDLPEDSRWSFDHPFFLVLTLAVGPRWLGPPDASTPWPATMLVDWVRVRMSRATFCPIVRARELRARCPRR